jgi:hypothetical protein
MPAADIGANLSKSRRVADFQTVRPELMHGSSVRLWPAAYRRIAFYKYRIIRVYVHDTYNSEKYIARYVS